MDFASTSYRPSRRTFLQAAATGVLLGGPAPRPLVWAGVAVVAVGLALGFREGKN